jgi:hypothetical protein
MGCTSRAKLIFGRFATGSSKEKAAEEKEKPRRKTIAPAKKDGLIKQESELQQLMVFLKTN